jgi:hypothetical protein
VVEPRDFSFSLQANAEHDSAAPAARNRFSGNTLVAGLREGRVIFGKGALPGVAAFDAATGVRPPNRLIGHLADLDRDSKREIEAAFGRILGVLDAFAPAMFGDSPETVAPLLPVRLRARPCALEGVFLASGGRDLAFRLRSGDQKLLLVDVGTPGTVEIEAEGSIPPVLWDFPPLEPPKKTEMRREGDRWIAPAKGPMAVVEGS